jgi:hypothetical protein
VSGIGFAALPIRAALAAAVLGVIAALGLTAPASACLGQYMSGAPELDNQADLIFTGTAVRRDGDPQGGVLDWTFVVDGVEKGRVGDRFTVSANTEDSMCGFFFELGARYRVLAADAYDAWKPQVSSVGGTTTIDPLPNPPAVEGTFPESGWPPLVPAVALAGLTGLALFAFATRRRRSRPAQT